MGRGVPAVGDRAAVEPSEGRSNGPAGSVTPPHSDGLPALQVTSVYTRTDAEIQQYGATSG